jgi:hypothetical protein
MSKKNKHGPGSCCVISSVSVVLPISMTSSSREGSDEPSKTQPPCLLSLSLTVVRLFSEAVVVTGPAAFAFRSDS